MTSTTGVPTTTSAERDAHERMVRVCAAVLVAHAVTHTPAGATAMLVSQGVAHTNASVALRVMALVGWFDYQGSVGEQRSHFTITPAGRRVGEHIACFMVPVQALVLRTMLWALLPAPTERNAASTLPLAMLRFWGDLRAAGPDLAEALHRACPPNPKPARPVKRKGGK